MFYSSCNAIIDFISILLSNCSTVIYVQSALAADSAFFYDIKEKIRYKVLCLFFEYLYILFLFFWEGRYYVNFIILKVGTLLVI